MAGTAISCCSCKNRSEKTEEKYDRKIKEKNQNSEREKRVSRLGSCDVAQRQSRHRSGFLSWSLQLQFCVRLLATFGKMVYTVRVRAEKKQKKQKKMGKKMGKNG